MECPELDTWVVPVSGVSISVCREMGSTYGRNYYSPTIFQLQQFCRKADHKRCPFLIHTNGRVIDTVPVPVNSKGGAKEHP